MCPTGCNYRSVAYGLRYVLTPNSAGTAQSFVSAGTAEERAHFAVYSLPVTNLTTCRLSK